MTFDLGVITAERMLNDNVFQKAISATIMDKGFDGSKLFNENIITNADMHGDLEVILPGINSVQVHEDVAEGQVVGITNAKFQASTLKLAKCSGIVTVTDEAEIRASAHGIDAFQLQIKQVEDALARRIDKQIVGALDTTPQTGTTFSFSTGKFYDALAEAEEKIEKDITAVVCSPQCRTKIFGNINAAAFTGSNPAAPYNMSIIPGTDVPVFASRAVTTDSMYFVSSKLDAVIFGKADPLNHTWRDDAAGTTNMRIDNFTGVLSNYWQTESNTASGVVKTAWTSA